MRFLRIFQHLLPRALAWDITIDKQLRQFFVGLSDFGADIKLFLDLIYLDVFPQTTRELDLWEKQFAITTEAVDEQARRDRLEAAWRAQGGQDISYIQTSLQDAGFDVVVQVWWAPGTELAVGVKGAVPALDPNDYSVPSSASPMEKGLGYPLVNRVIDNGVEKVYTLKPGPEPYTPYVDNEPSHHYVMYIAGAITVYGSTVFLSPGLIPAESQTEFETLLLKICPAQQWIIPVVEYTAEEPTLFVPLGSDSFIDNGGVTLYTKGTSAYSGAEVDAQTTKSQDTDATAAEITRAAYNANRGAAVMDGKYLISDGAVQIPAIAAAPELADVFDAGGVIGYTAKIDDASSLGYLWYKGPVRVSAVAGTTAGKIKIQFYQGFDTTPGEWELDDIVDEGAWFDWDMLYKNADVGIIPFMVIDGVPYAMTEVTAPVGTVTTDYADDIIIGYKDDGSDGMIGLIAGPIYMDNVPLTVSEVQGRQAGLPVVSEYSGAGNSLIITPQDFLLDTSVGNWISLQATSSMQAATIGGRAPSLELVSTSTSKPQAELPYPSLLQVPANSKIYFSAWVYIPSTNTGDVNGAKIYMFGAFPQPISEIAEFKVVPPDTWVEIPIEIEIPASFVMDFSIVFSKDDGATAAVIGDKYYVSGPNPTLVKDGNLLSFPSESLGSSQWIDKAHPRQIVDLFLLEAGNKPLADEYVHKGLNITGTGLKNLSLSNAPGYTLTGVTVKNLDDTSVATMLIRDAGVNVLVPTFSVPALTSRYYRVEVAQEIPTVTSPITANISANPNGVDIILHFERQV